MLFNKCLFLIVLLHGFPEAPRPAPQMPIIGYYDKERIYASDGSKDSLLVVNREGTAKPKQYFFFLGGGGGPDPMRFWFAHDCFWASQGSYSNYNGFVQRVPKSELSLCEVSVEAGKKFRERYPKDRAIPRGAYLWSMTPVAAAHSKEQSDLIREKGGGIVGWAAQRYDFLPTSATTTKVFRSNRKRDRLEVWDGKGRWLPQEQEWQTTWAEEPEEVFPCPFDEDFFVFAKGTTYFFLTRSGYLYYAEKAKKGERQMKAAWTNKKPPIKTVITDADTGTTYFFCPVPWEAKKRFYFELTEAPRPTEFPETDLRVFDGAEPLKTVVEYARLLGDRKKAPIKR